MAGQFMGFPPEATDFFKDLAANNNRDIAGRELAKAVASMRRKGYNVDTHETLTSAPRGYSADHPRIELLRMKDIFAGKALPVRPWLATRKALERITRVMTDVKPLSDWLRRHVQGARGAAPLS